MFCKHCGTQVPDDAKFCPSCGGNLSEIKVDAPSMPKEEPMEENVDFEAKGFDSFEQTAEQNDEPTVAAEEDLIEESPKKKKKTGLIVAIVLAACVLILGIAAAVVFFLFMNRQPAAAVYAYVDADGYAYVCYDNGKMVKIGSEVEKAVMTPDHKKIVVITEDRMYWTDAKLSKKHVILNADEKDDWLYCDGVTDRFVLVTYEQETKDSEVQTVYRYEFETEEKVLLVQVTEENDGEVSFASNAAYLTSDIHCAVAVDGKIKVLAADQTKLETIDHYDKEEEIDILGVSEDGKVVAWVEGKGDQFRVLAWMDGEIEALFSEKFTDDIPDITMSGSADGAVVINGSNYSICIKDGEVTKTRFNSKVYDYQTVYTSHGIRMELDDRFVKADGYYVLTEDSEEELSRSVYFINFSDGEKTKLISKVAGFCMADDLMIYWDKDDKLKCGTVDLDQMTMENTASIASDVYNVYNAMKNTQYVYYTKQAGDDEEKFHLYVYDVEKDSSEKIASNISGNCELSYDGNTIYYLSDALKDKDTYTIYGTLNAYHANKAETEKIATDVCSGSLDSGLVVNYIDPDSFFFEKYNGSYENDEGYQRRIINVCYYDGKKQTTLLRDFKLG